MKRKHSDWLTAFLEYSSYGEAPRRMYFWSGVSAIAGALRRKVWIDMAYFKWYPNFYIILVAPPGIVAKTTTADMAIKLLKQVPEIRFGPDVVTWQSLVTSFAESSESFQLGDEFHVMSPITIASGEFGNFLNPQDRDMVDLLVTLWDGKQGAFVKQTKHSGNDSIENPWINIIACTTPSWIAGNFPEYMIGGGFTSRCIFIYADKKERYSAYPSLAVPAGHKELEDSLVHDLSAIATNLTGEYKLTKEAYEWGTKWYTDHYEGETDLDQTQFGGYRARKQSHIHKLAMILAASSSDQMTITATHLQVAETMITDLEQDVQKVFTNIGRTEESDYSERIVAYISKKKTVSYDEVYRFVYAYFPNVRDFENIMAGLIKARMVNMAKVGTSIILSIPTPAREEAIIQ